MFSVLPGCTFPVDLARESRFLLGLYFFFTDCHDWEAGFLSFKSVVLDAKTKPREQTAVSFLGPEVSRQASSSPSFSHFLMFALYILSRVFSYTWQEE